MVGGRPLVAAFVVTAVALGSGGILAPGARAGIPGPPITGTWFDGLDGGVCWDPALLPNGDLDFSVPVPIVDCDGPHAYEIAARAPLGAEGDPFPSGDLGALSDGACGPGYETFLGRPVDATDLAAFEIWPDERDWAAGARDALCIVLGSEPLTGTAASGDLRAPGETLAAFRQVGERADIWLIDGSDGTPLRQVTDGGPTPLLEPPAWSPDGTTIAYGALVADDDVDAYAVSIDGGEPTPLITGPGTQDVPGYAPDGSRIAFVTAAVGAEADIAVRDLATGEDILLTDHPGQDGTPRWSPDGTRIAFRRVTDGISDIWVMGADGSRPVRLTDNGHGNYDPRWSPDGEQLLFTSDALGNHDVWVMNADGTGQRPLTTHPASDEYPAWSSDGSLIAFQSARHGGPTLWLMRADGSDASLLAARAPVGFPAFSPAAGEE